MAIRHADIQSIAGDYPPPAGSADEITYVVRTRAGTVRIAPALGSRSEEVMPHFKPLLKVLKRPGFGGGTANVFLLPEQQIVVGSSPS